MTRGDDHDMRSKSLVTFLMFIFSLTEMQSRRSIYFVVARSLIMG